MRRFRSFAGPRASGKVRPFFDIRPGAQRVESASLRKPIASTADRKGRLDRSAFLTPFVSLSYAPLFHPDKTPQARRSTG
jgi:hypothetical protein